MAKDNNKNDEKTKDKLKKTVSVYIKTDIEVLDMRNKQKDKQVIIKEYEKNILELMEKLCVDKINNSETGHIIQRVEKEMHGSITKDIILEVLNDRLSDNELITDIIDDIMDKRKVSKKVRLKMIKNKN